MWGGGGLITLHVDNLISDSRVVEDDDDGECTYLSRYLDIYLSTYLSINLLSTKHPPLSLSLSRGPVILDFSIPATYIHLHTYVYI